MGTQTLIFTLFGMALVTIICRALPLTLMGNKKFSPLIEASLKYVPVSILSAMLATQVLMKNGKFENVFQNTCLWVTSLSFFVAFASRSLLMTVAFGVLASAAICHLSI